MDRRVSFTQMVSISDLMSVPKRGRRFGLKEKVGLFSFLILTLILYQTVLYFSLHQFYSKLEEEKNAKKEEMTRMRAKTEKEDEEALKLLRRSLTFRASPLPGFYHEGPPPKPELKKVPTTQAKSPKFTSRSRRSVPNALDRSLQKDTEYNQCDGLQICKEGTSNETGRSADVTVKRERSTGSSENLSFQNFFRDACERMDERKADDEEVRIDTVCANRNENKNLMENDSSGKGPVSSFHKEIKQTTDKGQGRCGSNVLRNCANKGMALKSLVPGRISPKLQTLTHDMKEDMSPMPNKMNKKERLKALTPYFRKRESAINVRRQPSTLTEFHAGGVLQCEAEEMKIGT
ncbi:hypothetical protein KP509_37G023300 [Ceratopteris richardii]|uniref:TPX2 C-terminal domain-containing protein n=1 Tax=Ceratopteris richardii TaxID=49495 RepID=A0A8T2Q6E1_CERRI|nr:hypothetical protein KP509_37G023300 [Ceratopteris richardii]